MKEGMEKNIEVGILGYCRHPSGGGEGPNSESGHRNEVGWSNLKFILGQNF